MKGFSERNIRAMRMFYEEYVDDEKWQQVVAKLPWEHNLLLIEITKLEKIILEELKIGKITGKYLYEKVNAIYINNEKTIDIEYKNNNIDV